MFFFCWSVCLCDNLCERTHHLHETTLQRQCLHCRCCLGKVGQQESWFQVVATTAGSQQNYARAYYTGKQTCSSNGTRTKGMVFVVDANLNLKLNAWGRNVEPHHYFVLCFVS